MNLQLINTLYKQIISSSPGAERIKIDLHVHTPASHDFVYKPLSKEEAYLNLLNEAIEKDIRIIAITDHNTFEGVKTVRKILQKAELAQKYNRLLILCGIEITCFSKHLLAIFPDSFREKQQDDFLDEIGIDLGDRGSEDALADNLGPALLIQKIEKVGGFAILAHADNNKGFLHEFCEGTTHDCDLKFTGKSLAKIIKSTGLLGIQCNSDANKEKLKFKLCNKDYTREGSPLAYIKCSDCHGICINGEYKSKSGRTVGSVFTEVKMSEISFESLKMALQDSEMRVCDGMQNPDYAFVEGVAVQSGIFDDQGNYAVFRFSNELNCIIGSRGTGKTTLLEIIQSIIMPNALKGNSITNAYSKYEAAVVFLRINDAVYAVSAEPKKQRDSYTNRISYDPNLKTYVMAANDKKFGVLPRGESVQCLESFLTAGYQQRQLYDYSRNPDMILEIVDDFISWKRHEEYVKTTKSVEHLSKRLAELLSRIKKQRSNAGDGFLEFADSNGDTSEIIRLINNINIQKKILSRLRVDMVQELNSVLTGKVRLTIKPKLSEKNWKSDIECIAYAFSRKGGKDYAYTVKIKKCLEKAYGCSCYAGCFDFYSLLLKKSYDEIRTLYKMPNNVSEKDFSMIRQYVDEDQISIFIDDGLKLEYNINAGTEHDDFFRDNSQISMGQNAVALLLLILNAAYNMDDTRPLLMDQPEDDLDNSYIFSTLVKEFRKSKQKRQVIISTHNPNIPVAADAENILVLRYNGRHGYLSDNGAIDSEKVAGAVLEVMEGGREAIKRRIGKYNTRYADKI